MYVLEFAQKEQKKITFTYRDSKGRLVDLTGVVFSLSCRHYESATDSFVKVDADFDKTDAIDGVVRVLFTSTNLNLEQGTYLCELRASFTVLNEIDKTEQFEILIRKSITG